MEKITTVTVHQEAAGKLGEMAEKYKISKKEMFGKMVEFFYRTGHNPEDFKVEGSAAAIKQLDKRFVSFMRTQEKEKLNPLLEEIALANRQLQEFLNEAPTKIQLQQVVENQRKLKELFEQLANK